MYTITLNGNASDLSCNFFPPLEVSRNANICLLGLQTNNSIPNINDNCNQIGIVRKNDQKLIRNQTSQLELNKNIEICLLENQPNKSNSELNTECKRKNIERYSNNNNELIEVKENYTLPTGSYELEEIEAIIKHILPDNIKTFELKANNNTLKCEMLCSEAIDFSTSNSIGKLLGFKSKIYEADIKHQSEMLVNISKVNCIYIESNVAAGSFNNGKQCHSIHEFFLNVPPGYKIIEIPKHLVFYSLNCTTISHLNITLKDEYGELIDFRGEPISIRLLIKDNGSPIL